MKNKTVIIFGPTASGKTQRAVQLARRIGGEIISADSRQVFRGMDLGTGKDLVEYEEIPYHLIDCINPSDEFSVTDFQELALIALKDIVLRKKIPILCGGTGHYIKALIEDYSFDKPTDLDFTLSLESKPREELYRQLKTMGLWTMRQWETDSKRRIARAIEKKLSSNPKNIRKSSFRDCYDTRLYYTSPERIKQRKLILNRLNQRLEAGLIGEVEGLLQAGVPKERLERFGLEYKWILYYILKQISLDEMRDRLFTEICRFAKRQRTFNRYLIKSGHPLIRIGEDEDFFKDVEVWLNQEG